MGSPVDPDPAAAGDEQAGRQPASGGPGGSIADRFRLGRLLKRGNGVSTYLGEDLSSGVAVVVKAVSSDAVSTAVQLRLQHEALVLERLGAAAPGFRPLVASGHDGGLFYLVQPVVLGATLAERLVEGPLPVAAALSVAIDVLRALQVAHDEAVLHRDVKPANVIVQPGQPAGTTVLVDFGLARSAGLDASLEGESVGTARYVAPEAAGLLDADVDQRSDLYSLGVLLFECLSGRPPFPGTTVGEVLRQHLSLPPPQLRCLGLPIPRALDGVVQRLLAKEPAERYQSAAAVLADLEAVSLALENGITEPALTPGLHDLRHVVTEPAFVGRTEELATLTGALDRAASGRGGLVLIEAESGVGKTRLLDELAVQATQRGAWVLRGQGLDQAARRPFQLLDGVVTEIVRAAGSNPSLAKRLQRLLGDRREAAAAAMPPLVPVLGSGDAGVLGPEAFGEVRSVEALAALLDAVGTAERPALVVLDDAQWADGVTSQLLTRWTDRPPAAGRHVLVVVAFRSEEVEIGHPLRALEPAATVRLGAFEEADIAALCESMVGPLPVEALAVVARLADGVPFMGSAVLRGMVESGALRSTSGGWEIDPDAMGEVRTSRRAALVLLRRFELLSPAALRLLDAGAVLGKAFELELAVELTGQAASEVTMALDEARRRRILWVDEESSTCSFTHDKLRETLLARLPASELRSLHRRAAERIEATEPDRVFELAYHFDAAGEQARMLPYAVRAARLARGRYALDNAVTHFRLARKACEQDPGLEASTGAAVSEGLADVLILQGSYGEARELLEEALGLTVRSTHRAVLDGKLGDLAFKRGDQIGARRHLERSLRDLGRWVPRRKVEFLVAALWEVAVQVMHTLFPRRLGRRSPDGGEREFLAMRLYSRLAYVYWFHAGKMPCAWTHLRGMNLAERYPPTPELAQAYSEHAPVMTMVPWTSRGIAYAQRSYEIRRDLGDVWGQGQSLGFHGVVLYAASRYAEAIDRCEEAVELLARTGDRWEEHTARWHIAFSRYRLGELGPAVQAARLLHESATAIGDQAAAGISLSVWAKAGAGRVPADLVAAELERDNEDAHTTTEVLVAEGIRLLHSGDVEAAVTRLRQARALVRRSGLRQEYVAPVWAWLATAQRTQLELAGGHGRRSVVRAAARSARRADWLSRSYRNNRPHALRERGLIADLQGQPFRARNLLAKSLAVAEEQGARYEAALSRLASARVALAAHRLGPGVDIAALAHAVAELEATVVLPGDAPHPIPASLSLADRFESILAIGRQIAAAPSPTVVYRTVRDAALTLLRGDRCHVVLVGEGAVDLVTESGERIDAASRGLLQRAIAARAPVTTSDADAVDPSESLLLSDLRSVLCAPIMCEDEVVACLYTTHHQIGGLFGETEIKLAAFVATLAGAALDHMAGSEARFRSLAQNSSDVITIVNAAGLVTYQSSSVGRVFGYTGEELLGRDVRDWVHPDDLPQLVPLLAADPSRTAAGISPLLDMRLRHRDGTWRHSETAVTSMFDDPSVRGLVLNTRDVSERVALEAELRVQALQDPLTGLANRKLFTGRVDTALARRAAEQRPVAVAFLDIDDFKSINDTLGHAAGDVLLREVGRRLLVCVRPDDTVARFGGDEFALLLEGTGAQSVEAVGQRLMHELGQAFRLLDQEVLVRASVGLAVAEGHETTEELLSGADTAMYVAKARGKSRFEVFRSPMRQDALERSSLRTDLEWALPRDELALHYQPVMDVPTGNVRGFEALVRWNHPRRGLLQPGEFIDLAEQSGLILSIGAWVLRRACEQAQVWRRTFDPGLSMSVNVSARQLQHPELVSEVATALQESGLDPSGLVLEITESATVSDTEAAIARLEELKVLGVGLAIDDFGTGYSSLSYLRRFPVDQLKVDRSFVDGLVTSAQDRAIVASVINLGHALGIQVVAEGVETIDQLEQLGELGCDLAQGFNWDQPAMPEIIGAWLTLVFSVSVSPRRVPGSALRVLIADDRPHVRAAVRLALETDQGFVIVAEAGSGEEAVAMARRHQPDLAVLDVAMPGSSGIAVLPALRVAAPGATVVLLTALDRSDVIAEAAGAADGILDKTQDLAHLGARLQELLAS